MRYQEFERIVSEERMRRYVEACEGDTRKAMTLYRYNIELSQTMFAIICQFEVALRNAVNTKLTARLGNDWLRDSVLDNGVFTHPILTKTREVIRYAYGKLQRDNAYTHTKLLAEMEFGIWKYMFSPVQYRQTGRVLLSIFPNRPRSSAQMQYNHSYFFNELDKINTLRNRIAHHEPICFPAQSASIYTTYILTEHQKILTLLEWMDINVSEFLYGLDHVKRMYNRIEKLKSV